MIMKTRKTFLTLMLVTAASALSVVASAGVLGPNPDNDSGTYFTYKPAIGAANTAVQRRAMSQGELSSDRLYVYTINKGWVARGHSFVAVNGRFEHSADCLVYDAPKPAPGKLPVVGSEKAA
jgi:hypothetical protein